MSTGDTRFADPFEDKLNEIASSLPQEKLKRLIHILQRYQGTSPERLPPDILQDLNEIIDTGEMSSPPRGETTSIQRDTVTSPPSSTRTVSISRSGNYFARMSKGEKLRMFDEVMSLPECTVPKEVIPNMPDEMKSDLFEKLVNEGIIKWEKAGG